MYDSHAHLTMSPILENIDSILKQFEMDGGLGVVNMSSEADTIAQVINMYLSKKDLTSIKIFNAIGIHPEYLTEIASDNLSIYDQEKTIEKNLDEWFSTYKDMVHMIGECGIDYHHLQHYSASNPDFVAQLEENQRKLFAKHVEMAVHNKLPISIHSRDIEGTDRATVQSLNIVADIGRARLSGIFHSYTGERKHLNTILDLGLYISFNGIATYPKADNVRELIKLTPIDRILLETDAPLLPPQSVRKDKKAKYKYAIPSHVKDVAMVIAQVKGMTTEGVIDQTNENFKQLFLLH